MSLALSPEQEEIQRSLRKLFTELFTSQYVRERFESSVPSDAALFSRMRDLGLFEYLAPPSSSEGASGESGAAGGVRDLGLLAFESGWALSTEPLLEALLAGPLFLKLLAKEPGGALNCPLEVSVREGVTTGRTRATVAPMCGQAGVLVRSDEAGCLTGEVRLVPGLLGSEFFLLPVSSAQAVDLFLVQTAKSGSTLEATLDRTVKRYRVTLNRVPAWKVPTVVAQSLFHIERSMRAAELAGIGARVVETTKEYVKSRKQFGVAIGSFQAVQHKLADALVKCEALDALASFAAWSAEGSPEQFPFAAESALAYGIAEGASIVECALQLHGGIGFTWEYDLHLFLRRAKSIEAIYRLSREEEAHYLALARRQVAA